MRSVLAAFSLGLLITRRSLSWSILVLMVEAIWFSIDFDVLLMRPLRQVMDIMIMDMMPAGMMDRRRLVSQNDADGLG